MSVSSTSSAELTAALAQAEARIAELSTAFAQSNLLLTTVTERLAVGLLYVGADGVINAVNGPFLGLLELDVEAGTWVGRPATELEELIGRYGIGHYSRAAEESSTDRTIVLPAGQVLRHHRQVLPDGAYVEYLRDNAHEDLKQGILAAASVPEQSPYPMIRYAADGEVLYANPAAWRLRQELGPEYSMATRARFFALADDAMQEHTTRQVEMTIGDQEYLVFVAPFPGEQYINVYLLDITDRNAAQAHSRASEEKLQEQQAFTQYILDNIPNTVAVITAAGQTVFANQAYHQLLEQMDMGEEAAHRLHAATARVLRTGRDESMDFAVTLRDGLQRWLHLEQRRLARPGYEPAVLMVSTDVTALTAAQRELARNERRYNELMDYAQALIWTHDLDGRVLTANPALSTMIGLEPAGMVGRPLHDAVEDARLQDVADYLEHIRAQGEHAGVVKLRDQQGGLHYVQQYSRLVDESDDAPHVMAFGHEITERVLAAREMQRAKEAAEAAATARANFLANMSHEIRTPLNGVLGMATLLAKTPLDSRQSHFLEVIRSSGQHLLGVINDVLDMAKISSGKLDFEQTAFNLCDSMGQAIQPLVLQAAQKGLTFSGTPLRTTCSYPWVLGDAHRLNQILINLTANAIKFTDAGGHVEVVGQQVSETEDTLTVTFRVTDTGPGIPPERLERIFDSFTQAYADTSRRHGGTGLGLTISRALVEQMGGQLTASSEMGKGSVFAFTITLPKADRHTVLTPLELDTSALHGKRVLLVEDNEINRDVARLLLEEWGVTVDEAINGEEGVRLFLAGAYDAVLMDIQMPGMNGLDATAQLRRHPDALRAATPIVALTANAFREDNEQYLAAGMNACLAKPFEEADLYNVLAQVLAQPRAVARPAYNLGPLRDMARGKEAFVTKIIRSFLANIPESLAALQEQAQAGRWADVARIVHHIKPNLTSLRITDVDVPVAQLEQFRHDVPVNLSEAELQQAVEQLVAAVGRALAELPRELPVE
ncbi:ATP-binding protein [Hymenobacter sp. CRA2]|uniref:ATP-binding protein n=1 Tax=Hymenobacter sp. CRA2 TaxID=1955620 RepID=UPI00098FDB88|nr:ATP-binding protein [Hymenobacter sp. CRA2]OON69657.1 hypothetical protein B0919_06915 [Hymenobacter sp. CRA2]